MPTRDLSLDATPEQQEALATELGVDPRCIREVLAFVRACSDAAERLNIEPETAIHGLIGFISNAITHHYREEGWRHLHVEAANELLGSSGAEVVEVADLPPEDPTPNRAVH